MNTIKFDPEKRPFIPHGFRGLGRAKKYSHYFVVSWLWDQVSEVDASNRAQAIDDYEFYINAAQAGFAAQSAAMQAGEAAVKSAGLELGTQPGDELYEATRREHLGAYKEQHAAEYARMRELTERYCRARGLPLPE